MGGVGTEKRGKNQKQLYPFEDLFPQILLPKIAKLDTICSLFSIPV